MANTKISALTAITGANIATNDLIDIVDVSDIIMGVSGTNKKTTFSDLSARPETMTNKTLTAPVINSPTGLAKNDVGLGSVDNTSDASKNVAVATLTNKTLVSPVINTPMGIVKNDVGLGNVDNTSDSTKNAASATLTNKIIALGSNSISGTKDQFDTAVSDGNPVFEGDNATDLNMSTARMLGRSSFATGAVEEIAIGPGLSLFVGVLSATVSDKSVRVYQTSTTSLGPTPTWVSIAFGAEHFDTDTMHDNATNNTRITITTAGKYAVGGTVATDASTSIGARIRLNGTTILARQVQGNSNEGEGASLSTIYSFTDSDYIELQGITPGAQSTTGNTQTNFWAYKIS